MTKKHKIILLPTNNKSPIVKVLDGSLALTNLLTEGVGFHHLYVLSDEEIKEKNYYFDKEDGLIFRCKDSQEAKARNDAKEIYDIERYYKVIASTQELLYSTENDLRGEQYEQKFALPNIPQDFINKYIESYNSGNVIEEVEVEYDENYRTSSYSDQHRDCFFELKLDQNNNISIKLPVVTVEEAAKQFALDLYKYPKEEMAKFPSDLQKSVIIGFKEGIKWAKQNLK